MKLHSMLAVAVLFVPWVACSGAEPSGPPEQPSWVSIEPMAEGLHLRWEKRSDCDIVSVERKSEGSDFDEVAEVDCRSDNKHDGRVTVNQEYTYRLRARAGDEWSEYSETMTATPEPDAGG